MSTQDAINNRIAQEQRNIKIDGYEDIAFEGAWRGRTRGMWASSVVGAVAGAAIGLIAPFFTVFAGVPIATAVGLVGASVAVYSALGLGTGFAVGGLVGVTSGASAAVAKEVERREKGLQVAQVLQDNPEASLTTTTAPKMQKPPPRIEGTYVNYRSMAAFIAIGMMGGAIMFTAFMATGGAAGAGMLPIAKPLMDVLLGAAASSNLAVAAYSIGVTGAFGALFGMNFPKICADTTRFFGGMLSGKTFGRPFGPGADQERKPVMPMTFSISENTVPAPEISEQKPRVCYQDLIKSSRIGADSPDMIVRG